MPVNSKLSPYVKELSFYKCKKKSDNNKLLKYLFDINMAEEEEIKNDAYKGSRIIYEDDKVIFLKCDSYESSKYFGPEYLSKDYDAFNRNGDIFIVVDKKGDYINPTLSYVIFKKNYGDIVYYDFDYDEMTPSDLFDRFPQIEDKVFETVGVSDIYGILRKIQNGEEYPEHTLSRYDDLVSGFKFNKNTPSKSMVTLKFSDDEDYFTLFDLGQDDMWFLNNLFNSYSYDMDFYHSDFGYEDWKEGYLMREMDDENRKKVLEITSFMDPSIKNLDNDENVTKASKLLMDNFRRETESIVDDYISEKDSCMAETAKTSIRSELCDPFQTYGLFNKGGCFYTYITTVNVLLGMYKIAKDRTLNLQQVLSKIAHQISVGPYQEYMYEYGCDDFDSKSWNSWVSNQLDKILVIVEESDMFINIDEYKKIASEVLTKYNVGEWYKTPKDKKLRFKITEIDPKTNKIFLQTQKQFQDIEKRSYTLEEFNNFLYNLEIFENKTLKFKKKM
jgi:hypothetical protein